MNFFRLRNNQNVSSPSPGILQLKNLQPDQEGTYICSASNGIGSSVQSNVVIQLLCKLCIGSLTHYAWDHRTCYVQDHRHTLCTRSKRVMHRITDMLCVGSQTLVMQMIMDKICMGSQIHIMCRITDAQNQTKKENDNEPRPKEATNSF